jgi:hypothetical protein
MSEDLKKFDHPCRETCSGWRQGRERGRAEANACINQLTYELDKSRDSHMRRIAELERKLDLAVGALKTICGGKCAAGLNPCAAREALEEIEK